MDLFSELRLRGLALRNRIGVSPMCQYSAEDGVANEWHLVHLGSRAAGGAGLVLAEATAVVPEGRISPRDLGLWTDAQVEPLARVVRFVKAQGAAAGIQLAHAGRKASTAAPWEGGGPVDPAKGGWRTVAPSPIPFYDGQAAPDALDEAGIAAVKAAFVAAARRSEAAGFDAVEIHAAHGYLLHQFLSPLSNRREDRWGGSFENRARLLLEVAREVRAAWPERLPVLVRLSATDWADGGWTLEETIEVSRRLAREGVDLVDVSSGGLVRDAKVPAGPGYQTAFAARVRSDAGVATATVGLLTSPQQADHVVRTGQADVVLVGRVTLRNPYWPLQAARELGRPAPIPPQYERGWT